jgi:site-specific recombinase XerD
MSDLGIFSRFVKNKRPGEVDVKQIDEFVQAQGAQGLKAATINRRLSAISSFYEFLISENEDDDLHNPVVWKRHSNRLGRHLPRDVRDEVVNQLLAVIDDLRDRAMFELMVGAGFRVGEVVGLQLNDMHPTDDGGLVRLRVRGKGDKERIAWLTSESFTHVQRWLGGRPDSDSPYLFLNQRGAPLSVAGVQYRLRQYCQQADVSLTCHQLRHTYSRRLVEQGMPIDSLAKLLGHSDLHTTQRYIDGADPTVRDDFRRSMRALERQQQPPNQATPEGVVSASFAAPQPDERPDPVELVDRLAHLAADLPPWLQQAVRTHTIRRIVRWQPHRAEAQTKFHFGAAGLHVGWSRNAIGHSLTCCGAPIWWPMSICARKPASNRVALPPN